MAFLGGFDFFFFLSGVAASGGMKMPGICFLFILLTLYLHFLGRSKPEISRDMSRDRSRDISRDFLLHKKQISYINPTEK